MSYNEPEEHGPDPLDSLASAAHAIACFGVAFAAIIYGLGELGVI